MIDLCHSAATLSLGRIKSFVFERASLVLNSSLGEACHAKTKLFIPVRLNMVPHDKGLCPQVFNPCLEACLCDFLELIFLAPVYNYFLGKENVIIVLEQI